ncbi:MAG: ATP-binding protein [Bryobacteraceae bacterium]
MRESEKRATPSGEFLIGGGIMGELIRSKDWAATPLGPIDSWPQSLRTTVSLCLASNFPINLIWGPEHIQIYNDGYRPLCAGKHPKSLGEDYTKTWASAWEILDEAFRRALAGETSFLENQRMFLDRNGYLEETFFTFTLSPIRDESGDIGGLFHPVTETTAQMLSQRRTRALQDLASRASHSKTIEEACRLAIEAIREFQLDLTYALIYLAEENGRVARLNAQAHVDAGTAISPEQIDLVDGSNSPWPFRELRDNTPHAIQIDLSPFAHALCCGPYPEPPKTAFVLPVIGAALEHPAGFLVLGVSPRLPLTDEYKAFVELIGAALTSAVVNARAYEEERERAEKLAELDRAKTAFFSNVSHEFRTPLTLMLGPLEELLAHADEAISAKREVIDLVHRNGLRLLRLVNTLLDFSRIEANRAQAVYEPVDLAALTRDLTSLFRSAIEKAGLALHVDCPDISESVYVDVEMWEKIVLNLLSNAFKYTFRGTITVAFKESESEVVLSVRDTGTGIPAKELSNIFKRFHRVQAAQGRTYEGTGIGLALVEDLVRLHGGKVWAESELGAGTTFRVVMPKGFKHLPSEYVRDVAKTERSNRTGITFADEAMRWLPTNSASSDSPLTAPHSNAQRKRIVLADDNADMRQYIQNILKGEFEVEAVDDGLKAWAAIRMRAPDLVLTDVMMPGLDGFGLLKEIRSTNETKALPIIMLSARAGEEARVEGIQAGADDYLVKPFNARELVARVRVNMELAHLRQELSREDERRRSAKEIERQWRLFDTALSHTPDSIYMFDIEGRLIYGNRALLQQWQKSLPDVLGKNLLELGYRSEIAAKLQSQMQEVIRTGKPIRDEASLPDSEGVTRYYDYVLMPVVALSGIIEVVVGSTRDVTNFRETNRALREANEDLQQFAYSASHDLQEPLRMVAIYSQLLKTKYAGLLDAQADMIIKHCVDGAVRMEQLIKDLLTYTSASAPVVAAHNTRLDDVFETTLHSLQAAITETNAQVTRSSLPVLKVEAVHLHQIMQNLIGNAVKYRSAVPPRIHVAARRNAEEWIISVVDNGIGIAPEYQEQVFGLFKRLNDRGKYNGTGIGLAICKKLVERYGGRIWVESELGKGSTFFIALPATENEPKNIRKCISRIGAECSTF